MIKTQYAKSFALVDCFGIAFAVTAKCSALVDCRDIPCESDVCTPSLLVKGSHHDGIVGRRG